LGFVLKLSKKEDLGHIDAENVWCRKPDDKPPSPIPGELRKYRGTWDNSIVRMFQIVYDDKKSPTPEIIYFMAHTQDEAQTWIKKIKENIAYVRNAEPLSHAGSSFVSNKSGSAKVHPQTSTNSLNHSPSNVSSNSSGSRQTNFTHHSTIEIIEEELSSTNTRGSGSLVEEIVEESQEQI